MRFSIGPPGKITSRTWWLCHKRHGNLLIRIPVCLWLFHDRVGLEKLRMRILSLVRPLRQLCLGGAALNGSLLFAGDHAVLLKLVGQLSHATDERAVIPGSVGALTNQIGESAGTRANHEVVGLSMVTSWNTSRQTR